MGDEVMEQVDCIVTGGDVAEVAGLLRIPALGDGRYGWRGLLRQAAELRALRVRELQHQVGYEVAVTVTAVTG